MSPSLKIIIISYNTKDLTVSCLEHLLRATAVSNIQNFVITLVDNASSDGTLEFIRKAFPQVEVIENEVNGGFAKACNQAIFEPSKLIRPDFYLFVNSDTACPKETIHVMLSTMQKHHDCGALGGQLVYLDKRKQHSVANWPHWQESFFGKSLLRYCFPKKYPNKKQKIEVLTEVQSLVGAFMMLRGKTLRQLKGLDERFFFFLEETDLCRRIHKKGLKVLFDPLLLIPHIQGASANKVPLWSRYQYNRSFYQYYKKWNSKPALYFVFIKNTLVSALKAIFYGALCLFGVFYQTKIGQKAFLWKELFLGHLKGFPPFYSKENLLLNNESLNTIDMEEVVNLIQEKKLDPLSFITDSKYSKSFFYENNAREKYFVHLKRSPVNCNNFFYSSRYFKNANRLYSLGVNVEKPCVYKKMITKEGTYELVISEALSNINALSSFEEKLREKEYSRRHFIYDLASWVASLHLKGIFYFDLKADNILIQWQKENKKFSFYLINLEKVYFSIFMTTRLGMKNLLQLNKNFPNFDQKDKGLFFLVYKQKVGIKGLNKKYCKTNTLNTII